MQDFRTFRTHMQAHFAHMLTLDNLFFVDVDRDSLWRTYIESFSLENRQEHNCNACRSFVKNYGGVVAIHPQTYQLISIWDFPCDDAEWQQVINNLRDLVYCTQIRDALVVESVNLGYESNTQAIRDPETQKLLEVIEWHHLYLQVPTRYKLARNITSIGAAQGAIRDPRNVLLRSLNEFSVNSLETVIEIIQQGSLYRGDEWLSTLQAFLVIKQRYDALEENQRGNFAWLESAKIGVGLSKIRNHAIGVLLIDLNKDVDLDTAVRRYENVVAPSNYKRKIALVSPRQIREAEAFVVENGLLPSLERRYAKLEDFSINNVYWANRDVTQGLSVFSSLLAKTPTDPRSFSKVEEISIDDFINKVLPSTSQMEIFFENNHQVNLMSLIAPVHKEAKPLTAWANNFTWYYRGDVTDALKETVEKRGGSVTGELRFSIQWNEDGKNTNDFDAHSILANEHIYFGSYRRPSISKYTTGQLDIDITNPQSIMQVPKGEPAVENISYQSLSSVKDNVPFHFQVHNFSNNTSCGGFTAQVEYQGTVYNFAYPKNLRAKEFITVARGILSKTDGLQFTESLPSNSSTISKEVWGLQTNTWQKVSLAMLSPNHWDHPIGNKHYFFIIEGTLNNDPLVRGFYNEFLISDLRPHAGVFEVLGTQMVVPPSDQQLSGLGFSSTIRKSFLAKVTGATQRILRVNV